MSILDYLKFANKDRYYNDDQAFRMSHHFENREKAITDFITASVSAHSTRMKIRNVFQVIISSILLMTMVAFAGMFVYVIVFSTKRQIHDVSVIVALIGSAGAFISSLFGLLLIVVKYVFPEYDDKNSMDLLKTAITTDFDYYKRNQEQKSQKDQVEKNESNK